MSLLYGVSAPRLRFHSLSLKGKYRGEYAFKGITSKRVGTKRLLRSRADRRLG